MESKEFNQPEVVGDVDDCVESGCDQDGFPSGEEFNATIAETRADLDADDFDEDFELSPELEDCETTFVTLPEMDIILYIWNFPEPHTTLSTARRRIPAIPSCVG